MENNKTNYYVDNCFDMELISKSGKLLGKGQVNIEHSFMYAKFCDKSHKKNFDFKISLKDILVVKEVDGTSDGLIIEIYYIKHELHRMLKMESIRFRAVASEATYFHILMDDVIQGFSRPRKLLVFINPISGRKKGLKIYRQQMAPICKLCGIECSVIVTNRRGQALEILDNYDLSSIDGIVTVGGDGIFSECVNGLLRRHQAEHNVDIHDTHSRLQPCNIPLGVIPAGSGNVLLELLHGNKDVQTAVLRIILGDVTRTNVAGVHQGGVLSVYACLILGFGLCGRMVRDCEKTRWMGPRRYSKNYVIRDRVYSIDTWIPTLTDISDHCHPVFGDSKITAHCVKECSFGDHLKHLLKVNERVAYCFKFDFVHALRGRGYRVRIFDTGDSRHRRKYYINYDGDSLLLKSSEFDVRLHRNIIKLFGTKEEDDISSNVKT
ncbi:ceramide kinase 1-like isoform X3 [Mytilus trossulus]|uniref:ceramide kinase 1-like isoform X3 n=1 Tax=Mytilus trossulus TaxID=6551 RepID=UPI00300738B1